MKLHASTKIASLLLAAAISAMGCSTSSSQTSSQTSQPAAESDVQREEPEETKPETIGLIEAKTVTGTDIEPAGAADKSPLKVVIEETKERQPTVEVMAPVVPPRHEPRDRYMRYHDTWHKQNPDGKNTAEEGFGNLVREAGGPEAWEATVRGYWIGGVNEEELFAHEESFGDFQFISRFIVDDQPVDLVLYQRSKPAAEPVGAYDTNYLYTVVAFDSSGDEALALWALDLSALFPGVLRMDDIQIDPEGKLLTNVNYQSYPKEVDGQTGWLYRVEPSTATVMWKSEPMTSRAEFFVDDDFVLAGYGFTDVDDALYVLDLETGERLDRAEIPSAPERIQRYASADGKPIEFPVKSGKVEEEPSIVLELSSGNILVVAYDAALEVRIEKQ
jgi:hypothetical protein